MNYNEYKNRAKLFSSPAHHFCLSFYSLLLSRGIDEDDISKENNTLNCRFGSISFIGKYVTYFNEEEVVESKCAAFVLYGGSKWEMFSLNNEKELFALVDLFIKGDIVNGSHSIYDENTQTFKRERV